MAKIKISDLKNMAERIIASKYYSKEEAQTILEPLLYAEMAGKNAQGLLKLLGTEPLQNIKPLTKAKIVRETLLSAVIDGGHSAGPLIAQLAADKVIDIALRSGFGIVATNNTFSSIGAAGFYALKMARKDLIGMVFANCPRSVLHEGSIEPVYGTNPLAFAFPTLENPIVFDMATSAITWYGLIRAEALGQKIPNNVAIDKEGNITIDPTKAMQGATLPFDGSYKGSGLAMVVELLAGALSGSSYVFDQGDWGATFLAISPDLLLDIDSFKKRSSDLITKIKATKTKTGNETYIPGYDLDKKIQKCLDKGECEIADQIFSQLLCLT